MRILITSIAILLSLSGLAQTQITAAEYFVGSDPGLGNATPIDIVGGQSVTGSFDVSVASLNNGLHYLHVRAQNDEGKWSLYMRQPFYVADFDVNNEIAAAEYFIGDDPGVGNGEPLSLTPGNTVSETFAIPVGELTTGLHFLHMRTQTASGRWSLYARKQFYVQHYIPDLEVVEAEYFIDMDPGIGNGLPLEISPAHQISENFSIVLSDTLSLGDHLLYIRVLNEADNWSFYASDLFTIDENVGMEQTDIAFKLYPNPAHGLLFLETGHVQPDFIRIIDMTGKVVLTPSPQYRQIDIQHLVPGTYLVQIGADGHLFSERLVKQ